MKKLPDNKSYKCIFKIIKPAPPDTWAYNKLGEYYFGLYSYCHDKDTNIFVAQSHLVKRGSIPASGWIAADKVKVIGWTNGSPDKKYREGLIEA